MPVKGEWPGPTGKTPKKRGAPKPTDPWMVETLKPLVLRASKWFKVKENKILFNEKLKTVEGRAWIILNLVRPIGSEFQNICTRSENRKLRVGWGGLPTGNGKDVRSDWQTAIPRQKGRQDARPFENAGKC